MKTLALAALTMLVSGSALADSVSCPSNSPKTGQVCAYKHFPQPAQDFNYPADGKDAFAPSNFGGPFVKQRSDTVLHCNSDFVITADPGTPVGVGIFLNGGAAQIDATDSVSYGTLTQGLAHTFDGLPEGTYDVSIYFVAAGSNPSSAVLKTSVSQLECSEQLFPQSQ